MFENSNLLMKYQRKYRERDIVDLDIPIHIPELSKAFVISTRILHCQNILIFPKIFDS